MSPMLTTAHALRQRMLRGRVCPVAVVGIPTTPSAVRRASSSRRFIMRGMSSARFEQQRREIAEIAPPDSPVMGALGFEVGVLDAALVERLVQEPGAVDRRVLPAARDPQEIDE